MSSSMSMSFYSAHVESGKSHSPKEFYRTPRSLTSATTVVTSCSSSDYTMVHSGRVLMVNKTAKTSKVEVSSDEGSSSWSDGEECNNQPIGNISFETDNSSLEDVDISIGSKKVGDMLNQLKENIKVKEVKNFSKHQISPKVLTATSTINDTDNDEFHSAAYSLATVEERKRDTENESNLDECENFDITTLHSAHYSDDDFNDLSQEDDDISAITTDVTVRKSNELILKPIKSKPAFEITKNVETPTSFRNYKKITTDKRIQKTKNNVNEENQSKVYSDLDDISLGDATLTDHESNNDVVPDLHLRSASFHSNHFKTTYSASLENKKLSNNKTTLERREEAYRSWLSGKVNAICDERAERRRQELWQKEQREEKKKKSQEIYNQWLKSKSETLINKAQSMKTKSEQKLQSKNITVEEAKKKVDEWKKQKKLADEKRRALKRKQEEEKKLKEVERLTTSKQAWSKWIKEAPKKPKPVPLNQGLLTLRGTISDIYVNDKEWVHPTA